MDPPALPASSARSSANPLARRLDKALSLPLDDAGVQAALAALADDFSNTLDARRSLRSEAEKREVAVAARFRDALGAVDEKLRLVEAELGEMHSACQDMDRKLENATKRTSHLIRQTSSLKAQSTKANTKKAVAERFLDLFTLTPTELALLSAPLTFTARDSNPPFFDVLDRLRSVSENTRALLTTEHQTAGTEIMQLLSSYQERAFDRLHKWTSAECRTLARDAADAAPALRRAFRALRSRPLLFRSAIDDAVNVRRQAVARQFVDALTRGGPGGTPRPIELHAHDPVRYIGDMLAWLHQASAGERELLEQMFSDRSEEDIVPDEIEAGTVEELMDRATEGTTRPLRMRVEQVLSSHPPPVVAYKIANILQFYRFTVGKILGDNAQLTRVLDELLATAERVFFDVINMQASRMVRMGVKMEGLAVPAQIKEAVGQLKEIMASYDSSLTTSPNREAGFAPILSALLDPILQLIAAPTALSAADTAVYKINNLHYILNALTLYGFTGSRAAWLESQMEELEGHLVQHETRNMLVHSGMAGIVAAMDSNSEVPLALLPGMDHKSVVETMARLDNYLMSASFDGSPALMRLTSSRIARSVRKRAVDAFVAAYRRWHEAATDPKNKYEYPDTMVRRSVGEVMTLIGLDLEKEAETPVASMERF